MKKKIIPHRHCVICGAEKEKKDFVRVVRNKDGEVSLDLSGKAQGRGAYICKDSNCLKKAKKSNRFEKVFGCTVDLEVYDIMLKEIESE